MIYISEIPKAGCFLINVYENDPTLINVREHVEKYFKTQTYLESAFVLMAASIRVGKSKRAVGTSVTVSYNGLDNRKFIEMKNGLKHTLAHHIKEESDFDVMILQYIDEEMN